MERIREILCLVAAAALLQTGCNKSLGPVGPDLSRPSEIDWATLSRMTPARTNDFNCNFNSSIQGFKSDWFSGGLGQIFPVTNNGALHIWFQDIYPGDPTAPSTRTWITDVYKDPDPNNWAIGYSTWEGLPGSGNWYYGFWYTNFPPRNLYQTEAGQTWVFYMRIKSETNSALGYRPQRLLLTMDGKGDLDGVVASNTISYTFPHPVPPYYTNVILTLQDFYPAVWNPDMMTRFTLEHCHRFRIWFLSEQILPGTSAGWFIDDLRILVY